MNYLDISTHGDLPLKHRAQMSLLLTSLLEDVDSAIGKPRAMTNAGDLLSQHWRRGARARIALHNDEVVGFILYYPSSDSFFVDWLVVNPDYRRQGIASSLITVIRDRASRRNALSLLLDVPPVNKIARAFYKKLGFCYDGPESMVLPIY